MTDKELQGKSLQHLLSITDELPRELTRDGILAQLRVAPSASLFILSKKARSGGY
jgi:hypothetical protein